jgi:APA family basic amino acid/polyamine antiporter
VQNLAAAAKLTGLAAMFVLMCLRGPLRAPIAATAPATSIAGFTIALIAVMWAYEGWHVISFVAGELRAPQHDLPRALLSGTGLVMAIYLTATIGYYKVLTLQQFRGSDTVAALAMGTLIGPTGATTISVLILVSLLGSLNGLILSGPRVYYATAREAYSRARSAK